MPLETDQCPLASRRHHEVMEILVFRCTQTGSNVQVWLPEALTPNDRNDSYEAVTCPACARVHLVNKTTGKTLGEKEK
jgi:hypothetical protein